MTDSRVPVTSSKSVRGWINSAAAWIADQGPNGDWSRRAVLDPALEQVLPELSGKRVLDVGCGEGRYSRILKRRGASVVGIDPVPAFIDRARSLDTDSTYIEAFAESLPLPDASFDLAICYLSIIDIPDLESASQELCRVLKSRGEIIIVNISNLASTSQGWVKDESGRKTHRILDHYMDHFSLDLEWRDIKITNYHRPLSYVLGVFLSKGFVVTQFLEPLPDASDPNYRDEARVPTFQIYSLRRSASAQLG